MGKIQSLFPKNWGDNNFLEQYGPIIYQPLQPHNWMQKIRKTKISHLWEKLVTWRLMDRQTYDQVERYMWMSQDLLVNGEQIWLP